MKLVVKSSDPEAGLKVRRWREKCRRESRLSIVIYEDEAETQVELKYPSRGGYFDFSGLGGKYKFLGWTGGSAESHLTMSGHYSHSELEQDILEILNEPREQFKNHKSLGIDKLDPAEQEQTAIAGFVRTLDPGPVPRLIFSTEEYDVVTAAVLAKGGQDPIELFCSSTPFSFEKYPLDERLSHWPDDVIQDWRMKKGNYLWEPRFPPGIILVQEHTVPMTTCSRPGIVGDQAVVQIDCTDFRGFALLRKTEQGWTLVQTSYDEDWKQPSWEYTLDFFDSVVEEPPSFVPEYEEWSLYPLPFPCPGEFVQPLPLEESHRLYDSISQGLSPEIDSDFFIPLCNGQATTLAALLAEAKETFDVHLNSGPTKMTKRLSEKGVSVVLLNYESSPSISKLLAYWGRDFSLLRVEDSYAEAQPATEGQKQTLERQLPQLLGTDS